MFLTNVSQSISTTTTPAGDSSAGSNASSSMPSPALTSHYLHTPGNANNFSTVSSTDSTSRANGGVGRGLANIFRNFVNGDSSSQSSVSTPKQTTTNRQPPPAGLNLDPQAHPNHLGEYLNFVVNFFFLYIDGNYNYC